MSKKIARESLDQRHDLVSVYVWLAGDVQIFCPPNKTEIHVEQCVGKDICFPGECRASEATDIWLELEKWFGDHGVCLCVCLCVCCLMYSSPTCRGCSRYWQLWIVNWREYWREYWRAEHKLFFIQLNVFIICLYSEFKKCLHKLYV